MTAHATPAAAPSTDLKAKHRALWASGDYPGMVERWLTPLGERLVAACRVTTGLRVLDVASGTGNTAIPAARAGAQVVASDLVGELLEAGRRREAAAGLPIEWVVADAENLPFADASFDVVLSSIGVMFAPDHQRSADEIVRVCRPGGTIGLLSWTPEGQIGQLLGALKPFAAAPPPNAIPAPRWGDPEHLRGLFGDRVDWTSCDRDRLVVDQFAAPEDWVEHLQQKYGPVIATGAHAAGSGQAEELAAALRRFARESNLGGAGECRFEMEYLVTTMTRR